MTRFILCLMALAGLLLVGCEPIDNREIPDVVVDDDDDDLTPTPAVDNDGDGLYGDEDCDDSDPSVGGERTWFLDHDHDGWGDASGEFSTVACEPPGGYVADGTDCDDASVDVHPDADEFCDGIDNDCDGDIDPNSSVDADTWYRDADGDGHGTSQHTQSACSQPSGFVSVAGDCVDSDPRIYGGATEVCDGVDNDCDAQVDEGLLAAFYPDTDGDGWGNDLAGLLYACDAPDGYSGQGGDCDDTLVEVNPAATEVCNGLDDDCDAQVDEGVQSTFWADQDGDGYGDIDNLGAACAASAGFVDNSTDCNDGLAAVNPGVSEICNGIDDDCDSAVDEGVQTTFWADQDGDGFGDPDGTLVQACQPPPSGWVQNDNDCDDLEELTFPGNDEVCDELDNNCDGLVDDEDPAVDLATGEVFWADLDGDGWGDPSTSLGACGASSGYVADDTDCDDADPWSYPNAPEACDSADNDCDGVVDENLSSQWYVDADGDGWGSGSPIDVICGGDSAELVADNTDCDDSDPENFPGNPEVADGADNDCDLVADEGTAAFDDDGDGFTEEEGDCDDQNATVFPGAYDSPAPDDADCDGLPD